MGPNWSGLTKTVTAVTSHSDTDRRIRDAWPCVQGAHGGHEADGAPGRPGRVELLAELVAPVEHSHAGPPIVPAPDWVPFDGPSLQRPERRPERDTAAGTGVMSSGGVRGMTRRRRMRLALTLAVCVLAAACTRRTRPAPTRAPGTQPPAQVERLRLAAGPPRYPSPVTGGRVAGAQVDLMFDHLVWKDATGEVIPWLATEWTNSADGTEWRYTIRDGVTVAGRDAADQPRRGLHVQLLHEGPGGRPGRHLRAVFERELQGGGGRGRQPGRLPHEAAVGDLPASASPHWCRSCPSTSGAR